MIMEKIAYGIHITDSFGHARAGCEDLVSAIYAEFDNIYSARAPWLVLCYTDESPQLLIGLEAKISKTTDFAALHKLWEDRVTGMPSNVRALMASSPLVEPDVDFMAGNH